MRPKPVFFTTSRGRPVLTPPSSSSTAEVIVAGHPDAIRRRREAEQRLLEREAERAAEKAAEQAGIPWYERERPANMCLLSNEEEVHQLMKAADEEGHLLVMDFFTTECYACKTLYPKLKQIAGENPDVKFAKINGFNELLRPFFDQSGVTKVPFFHLYRNKEVVSKFSASLSPEKLAQLRSEIRKHKQ